MGRSAAHLDSDADIGHGELIAEHEGFPREVPVQDLKGFLQTKSSRQVHEPVRAKKRIFLQSIGEYSSDYGVKH